MSFGRLRSDANHAEIVQALRQRGWLVESINRIGGFIDCVAFHPGRQVVRLVEIKTPKGRLKPSQQKLIDAGWPIAVLRSIEDAMLL